MNSDKLFNKSFGVLLVLPWSVGEAEGGVSQVVLNLLRQSQVSENMSAVLGVCSWVDKSPRYCNDATGRTVLFRLWFPNTWRKLPPYLARLPAQLRTLRKILLRDKIGVVNFHYIGLFSLNFLILRWLRLWQGKIILSFHGSDFLAAKKAQGVSRKLWAALLASADRVVAPSAEFAAQIEGLWPQTAGKVSVIPNGVDAEALRSQECQDCNPYPQPLPEKYILSIGGLDRKKGHDILLRAFKSVHGRYAEYHLLIVGRPLGFQDELRALAKDLQLEKYVDIVEGLPHRRVGRLYRNATLFVLPSRFESFGIVALEAGVFGVPVVASAVGGLQEILRNHVDGVLVTPEDVTELADGMSRLLGDPGLRLQMANAFKKRVEEKFSWVTAYGLYEELYLSQARKK